MRTLIFALSFLLAACSSEPSATAQPSETRPPNAEGQAPASQGQTRAPALSSGVTIQADVVARDLDHPWGIAILPDARMLVTERAGRLRLITPQGQVSEPIESVPAVFVRGQGGLLDVALSPSFASDRLVYISYAEPRANNENGTAVARGRLSDDGRRLENVQVIFRQMPSWASPAHFGSRLVFDREGRLYVTTGDRYHGMQQAQDVNTHLGKVIRINADGSVPSDNPFVGRSDARPEVWSYGHRNMQGADLHPDTGELWTIEHGAQGGDELNIPRAGRNYGWPIITYGEDYSGSAIGEGITQREGMEQPFYYWDPVIAPGDMDFYEGDLFPWRGDILIGGLASETLVRLEIDGERVTGEERLNVNVGRIRDLAEDSIGAIWVVTDDDNGRLIRLTPRR